jgi:hypothetical protein
MVGVPTPSALHSRTGNERFDDQQLRKDRITAIVVLLVFAALMVLTIWLASLGNGAADNVQPNWPMMP